MLRDKEFLNNGTLVKPQFKSPINRIYDFVIALGGQTRVMTNVINIPLTKDESRDIDVVFITPLMSGKNLQSAWHVSEKALSPETERQHL